MIRSNLLAFGTALGLFAVSSLSTSGALVWELDTVYEFNGANPSGTGPWATITLEDVGDHLQLTVESKLQASGEFFDKIGLSYSGTSAPWPVVTAAGGSGTFRVDGARFGAANFPQGERLNIVLDFANNAKDRFEGTDVAIFNITQVADLDIPLFTTLLPGNEWLIAAHVNGLGPNNEASAGLTGGGLEEIPIPEPSAYIAGALLLLPFAASTLRRLGRRSRAA